MYFFVLYDNFYMRYIMMTNCSFHLYMFFLILKYNCKYLCISLSTSIDVFTIHHHPQWIFSHFIIILNGYFHIFLSTIPRDYPYIIILTFVTYDIFPPFKPCVIWHVSLSLCYPVKRLTFGFFCFMTYLLELIP
jgi:hypothetical protein